MTPARTHVNPVITGLGIVSCLGCNLAAVTESLWQGTSGLVLDPERKRMGFRSGLTGALRGWDPAAFGIGRKLSRTMGEPAQYAYAASVQALAQAGFSAEQLDGMRAGLIFGNDSTVRAGVESWEALQAEKSTHLLGSGYIFQAMNSTVTMNLATLFRLHGANWTLSAACASGSHAVGQAAMLIRAGLQDVMLCGGAQEINPHCMAPFDALNAFSLRESDPARASRPFDRERDGLVPSGGGAAVILEHPDHARARGAKIYGEVAGYGFSSDGYHLSLPSSDGARAAMQMALADAGVPAEDIDYINAHATSTPAGDAAEARALAQVFPHKPLVTSTKSLTGHECWMAGASEVVYCALMAQGGFVAGNANYREGDADTQALNIPSATVAHQPKNVLSDSFGFGGTNACLVLKF
ncbi:MAG: beta-ketoacyl-[acyl-carrier-protein] synthase family protein [Candidatus Firestonebacteria bacterium]|nr:beta-ketoacyl-[acyl-carrier-protein] synthase family protein [Candidatus Firestonebacteria bacterium]